jgi:hypothetical protein
MSVLADARAFAFLAEVLLFSMLALSGRHALFTPVLIHAMFAGSLGCTLLAFVFVPSVLTGCASAFFLGACRAEAFEKVVLAHRVLRTLGTPIFWAAMFAQLCFLDALSTLRPDFPVRALAVLLAIRTPVPAFKSQ